MEGFGKCLMHLMGIVPNIKIRRSPCMCFISAQFKSHLAAQIHLKAAILWTVFVIKICQTTPPWSMKAHDDEKKEHKRTAFYVDGQKNRFEIRNWSDSFDSILVYPLGTGLNSVFPGRKETSHFLKGPTLGNYPPVYSSLFFFLRLFCPSKS